MADGVIPAGWYPDPADAGRLRRWDGREWTADIVLSHEPSPVMTASPGYQPTAAESPRFGSPPPHAAPPGAVPGAERIPRAGESDLPDWANLPGLTLPPDLSALSRDPDGFGLRQPLFDDSGPGVDDSFGSPTYETPRKAPVYEVPVETPVPEPTLVTSESRPATPPPPAPLRTAHAPSIPSQPAGPYAPPPSGLLYNAPPPPGVDNMPPPGFALPASSLPRAIPLTMSGASRLIPESVMDRSAMESSMPLLQPGTSGPARLPVSRIPGAIRYPRSRTRGVWMIAVLPALQFALVYTLFDVVRLPWFPGMQGGILLAPALFSLLFAAADRRRLLERGEPQVPSAVLGILAPAYLVARYREIGRGSMPPVVVWILLQFAAVGAAFVVLPVVVGL